MKRVSKMTYSAEETEALGERMGRALRGGEILALVGELGAGKTTLIKGLARGLGVEEAVTSPTFVLVKPYEGRLRLYHLDFYRLESREDFLSIGFDECLEDEGVMAIEWAEKFVHALPRPFFLIEMGICGDAERTIAFSEVADECRAAGVYQRILECLRNGI